MTGKFFVLEGLECSGKTTLFNVLKERLQGTNTVFISEAAERFAKLSPEIYKDKEAMEIAYLIDNAITIHRVNELIKKGFNVIMDRSWLCQLVYAQTRKALNPDYNFDPKYIEKQEKILKFLYPEVFANTVAIFLDLSIETIMDRASKNPSHHRTEEFNPEWLKIAKSLYQKRLKSAKKEGISIEHIKSDKPIKDIVEQLEDVFKNIS